MLLVEALEESAVLVSVSMAALEDSVAVVSAVVDPAGVSTVSVVALEETVEGPAKVDVTRTLDDSVLLDKGRLDVLEVKVATLDKSAVPVSVSVVVLEDSVAVASAIVVPVGDSMASVVAPEDRVEALDKVTLVVLDSVLEYVIVTGVLDEVGMVLLDETVLVLVISLPS